LFVLAPVPINGQPFTVVYMIYFKLEKTLITEGGHSRWALIESMELKRKSNLSFLSYPFHGNGGKCQSVLVSCLSHTGNM
jgi:hypothetical protein